MRILDRLHHWCKIAFIFLFLSPLNVVAQEISSLEMLLVQAKQESPDYQKIKIQAEADQIDVDSLMSLYNWRLSGGVNWVDAERPQTSPFAPAGTSQNTRANLRLEKQSALGVNPFVAWTAEQNDLSFPGRGEIKYETAALEAGVRLELMKVFFAKSASALFSQVKIRKEIAKLSAQVAERNFEDQVSRSYYQVLRSTKKLNVLRSQCKEYRSLERISHSRHSKRLIQEKDYLLVKILYENCLLSQKTLENNNDMEVTRLKKLAGLSSSVKLSFSQEDFPKTFKLSSQKSLDLKLAQKLSEAMDLQAQTLRANQSPSFDLTYSLKSEASEDGMFKSTTEALGMDLLIHTVGLNFNYTFGGSSKDLDFQKSLAESQIKKLDLQNLVQSLERDETQIKNKMDYLKEASQKASEISSLEKRKAKLYNKEYKNGRGQTRELVEAEVSYIKSSDAEIEYHYNLALAHLDYLKLKGAKE